MSNEEIGTKIEHTSSVDDVGKLEQLEEYSSERDKEIEKKIVRKYDLRILPILCLLYLLSYLDRSNIGNAKLGGLEKDLSLTSQQYQWSLSIFYFGYVIFDLPSNIVMRRWRPSIWLGALMFLWGVTAVAMAGVKNFAELATARIFLGVFEAGFFPGSIYYMSIWYTRKEYARRIGFFWSFSSLAGAFGGLIAYGITEIPTNVLQTWQLLFLIEGLPSVALALFAAWYLPNQPETAKFLTEEERRVAVGRLAKDAGVANDHSWSWAQVNSVFTDWKAWAYAFIYISGTSALQGVTLFLPSIISDMGSWTKAQSQALTTPPYFLAFIATVAIGWSSDRLFERALHMLAINALGLLGFFLMMFIDRSNVAVHYFAACLATISVYANVAVKVAWFNNNFAGLTRRAVGSAFIVSIGTIGGAIGGQIYYDPPEYFYGNLIAVCLVGAQTVLVILVRLVLAYENKRRSKLTEEMKEYEVHKYGGIELAGDRHPDFKYVL
ncbi:major facilitator superfamily domain-containing protein [Halteromyces radiatus]|uniref:major facilitator superfamily domain-containing protein n=1 Tax=Halteromyces radiatus TaxID=101107 RepID=UPI00221EE51E|nr:major facilitator superfamily domain-containing protein [Halteromyces radiatus]KAI8077779.1 major facilitator superfamily domain-containing protein [Halteromyces radiatus]